MTSASDEAAVPSRASAPLAAGESPIDWAFAERVALRTCGSTSFSRSPVAVTMPAELRTLTSRAQDLVEDFTGLRSTAGPAVAKVIDRPQWIRANLAGFRHLLDPLAGRLAAAEAERRGAPAPEWSRAIGRRAVGAELGLLLGFLSRRVLGQYDLLLPEEAAGGAVGGVVYYVGPNIAELESHFGFSPRDFRLWIALHEVTHRTQFTAVTWMRPYFLSLVDAGVGSVEPDPGRIFDALNVVLDRVRSGQSPLPEDGMVTLLATPEQRQTFARVQALMTLLEGHGNWVMDALGATHVRGQQQMSNALRQRRAQAGLYKIVMRLIGMEMKARQYEEGQKFIDAVSARAGTRGLDPAWRGPEWLPTLEELRGDADGWLDRVGDTAPAL